MYGVRRDVSTENIDQLCQMARASSCFVGMNEAQGVQPG
jgi:hypothetical protein